VRKALTGENAEFWGEKEQRNRKLKKPVGDLKKVLQRKGDRVTDRGSGGENRRQEAGTEVSEKGLKKKTNGSAQIAGGPRWVWGKHGRKKKQFQAR